MEYWEFNLYCKGYREVFYNEQMNIMKQSYYTGMFSRESKQKPKPLDKYMNDIDKQFHPNKYRNTKVDVEKAKAIHSKIQQLKEVSNHE